MSGYIDTDKLLAWCNETYQAQSTVTGKAYVSEFIKKVLSCPTADVDEIVRCKDCKYRVVEDEGIYCGNPQTPWLNDHFEILMETDDYCSYGERKEK